MKQDRCVGSCNPDSSCRSSGVGTRKELEDIIGKLGAVGVLCGRFINARRILVSGRWMTSMIGHRTRRVASSRTWAFWSLLGEEPRARKGWLRPSRVGYATHVVTKPELPPPAIDGTSPEAICCFRARGDLKRSLCGGSGKQTQHGLSRRSFAIPRSVNQAGHQPSGCHIEGPDCHRVYRPVKSAPSLVACRLQDEPKTFEWTSRSFHAPRWGFTNTINRLSSRSWLEEAATLRNGTSLSCASQCLM